MCNHLEAAYSFCALASTLSVMSQSGSLDKLSINTPKPVGFKVLGVEAPLRIYLLKPLSLTQLNHKHFTKLTTL